MSVQNLENNVKSLIINYKDKDIKDKEKIDNELNKIKLNITNNR
jgi:hypothetical protein